MSYPFDMECDFGYVHETQTCKNHAYWNERANQICKGKDKHLQKYGILVPCGLDVFTGVEYVCCKVVLQCILNSYWPEAVTSYHKLIPRAVCGGSYDTPG